MRVTNRKIASVGVQWQRIVGFSWLFDNPGATYRRDGAMLRAACDVDDARHTFYKRVGETCRSLQFDSPCNHWAFCALPTDSLHVTALNGFEQKALPEIALRTLLYEVPNCNAGELNRAFCDLDISGQTLTAFDRTISFKFKELRRWRSLVLAIELQPAGAPSHDSFQQLCDLRERLDRQLHQKIVGRTTRPFAPHITFGYFAWPDRIAAVEDDLFDQWNNAFAQSLDGSTIEFSSIGLYVYTDMVSLYRLTPQPGSKQTCS
jgi:hypothetical protein